MTRRLKILTAVSFCAIAGIGLFLVTRRTTGTAGQTVNAAIDNLLATGNRLLELPLFLLLAGAAILAAALALPLLRWGTKSGRITWSRTAVAVMAGLVLFGLALLADDKISRLQAKIADLHSQVNQLRMAPADPVITPMTAPTVAIVPAPADPPAILPPATVRVTTSVAAASAPATKPVATASAPATRSVAPAASVPAPAGGPTTTKLVKAAPPRDVFLIDVAQVPRNLSVLFGPVGFHPMIHDQATDIVEVDIQNRPAIAYMAVINLRSPGLEIKCGGSLTQKTLTSDFARANNCQVAINGEAGASPQANSGFGVWRGNMISAGKVLLKEDPANKRPFLAFDKQNGVAFTAMAAADRTVAPDKFNVIWGRLDSIIDDRIQTENERDRQPRTAMGISKDGSKLFLLVVDGRQQRYSIGFTRQEVGAFLQTFGAANGMLCDEGGSSCLYVKKFNRIINSPSDGEERPTYTHFGISLTPQ
jgi:exopolysaccharide biosynthesis protein